jgi:hypothetical protein
VTKAGTSKKKAAPVFEFGDFRFDYIKSCKHDLKPGANPAQCPMCRLVNVSVEKYFREEQEEKIIQNASVYQEGKRICSVCEHKSECASWAIKNETHGLWGGLSPYERRMFRKRRKIRFLDNI